MRLGTRKSRAPSGVERVSMGVSTSRKPSSSITLRISRMILWRSARLWCGFGRRKSRYRKRRRVSSAALISSSIGKGGVLALLRICNFPATSSTSPVANSGLAFWRLRTLPSTATTNSLRACSALACAAGCVSLLKTTWTMPVRSRTSRKSKLPRSRRRATQPITIASRPSSLARSSPQWCVRFRFPRKSSKYSSLQVAQNLVCALGISAPPSSGGRHKLRPVPQKRGSKDPPLQGLAQMFQQIRFAVLFLRAVRQRLQRPQAFGYFIIAENQRVLCAEFIRLTEGFAEFLLDRGQLNAEARLAQIFRRADGGGVSSFTHPGDVHVAALLGGHLAALLQRQDQAIFTDGKADALGWRSAKQFYQSVIAPAAADGILRTEPLRRNFKRRPHVIVQPAHEPPILAEEDAAHFELVLYSSVVRRAVLAEVIGDARQRGDNALLAFEFGIEHAQRIRFDAALAIRAEFVFHFQELGPQQLDVFRPALAAADRIDVQLHALQFQPVEKCHDHFNHCSVDRRRVAAAQHLRANLIKLTVAALLWPLPPKHRPHVVQLHGLRKGLHFILYVGATHTGSSFWA